MSSSRRLDLRRLPARLPWRWLAALGVPLILLTAARAPNLPPVPNSQVTNLTAKPGFFTEPSVARSVAPCPDRRSDTSLTFAAHQLVCEPT